MALPEVVKEQVGEVEVPWTAQVPEWKLDISPESAGAKARELWDEVMVGVADVPPNRIQVLFTGIGGALASTGGALGVRRHQDNLELPKYKRAEELVEEFGEIPEVLFLVASPRTPDNIIGLRGVAREFKELGVKKVIAVLTALPHERQDHKFTNKEGEEIAEVTMLKEIVADLAGSDFIETKKIIQILEEIEGVDEELAQKIIRELRELRSIDAAIVVQPHSLRATEFGLRLGFPLLPIDPFLFLIKNSGFEQVPQNQRFVLGPDEGRRNLARRLAAYLKCAFASASKTRAKEEDGEPTIFGIPDAALNYIKEHDCVVLLIDDEIREGGTIGKIAIYLIAQAKGIKIVVTKLIAAGDIIENLLPDMIKEVIITDAFEPIANLARIKHKVRMISLREEINKLIGYLKNNLVSRGSPNWLAVPEEAGGDLVLDLTVEEYE